MNTPSYNVLLDKQKLIRTIQDLCEAVNKVENNQSSFVTHKEFEEGKIIVIAEQSMPTAWLQCNTMQELITLINADETAVPGRMYLSTISLNDLPYYNTPGGGTARLTQAEMKVEVMASEGEIGKVILFTVTSTNSPYHWEYTSAWKGTGEWISFVVS